MQLELGRTMKLTETDLRGTLIELQDVDRADTEIGCETCPDARDKSNKRENNDNHKKEGGQNP